MNTSNSDVKDYYDNFVGHLVRDYICGNPRLEVQYQFVKDVVHPRISKALVIGCGSGESAYLIANVARRALVWAVDISPENVNIAQSLFPHRRITYQVMDVTSEMPREQFDVILLPDVYEHIPIELRAKLHVSLAKLLNPNGLILLTIPSESHQKCLIELGTGLQVVDEIVSLNDLLSLAREVDGHLAYYCLVNVFKCGDYVHAVIASGPENERELVVTDQVRLRRGGRRPEGVRRWTSGLRRRVTRKLNAWRIRRIFGKKVLQNAVNKLDSAAVPAG